MTAGTGFQVDPVRLRSTAPRFDAAGDRLEDAGNALRVALAAEGPCWGGDEAGQKFAESYLPQAEAVTKALGRVVEALHGIRAGLDASAATWEGCDVGTASRFGGAGGTGGMGSAGGRR